MKASLRTFGCAVACAAAWACGDAHEAPGAASVEDAGAPSPSPPAAPEQDGGAPPADAGAPPPVPPASCGAAHPGPPLASGALEGKPGYGELVGALDVDTVPERLDLAKASMLVRGVVGYMLEQVAPREVAREDARARAGMGRAVLLAGASGEVDFGLLRRGLHHHYLCARPVPASLDALRATYGDYAAWPGETIACSKPKGGPRRLREDHDAGVYVAETLVEGHVRETEVIFRRLRGDGQLDFAVYTEDGALTDRSTFATRSGGTVTTAAPYTCLTCHVDTEAGSFRVLRPTGTGAGCP